MTITRSSITEALRDLAMRAYDERNERKSTDPCLMRVYSDNDFKQLIKVSNPEADIQEEKNRIGICDGVSETAEKSYAVDLSKLFSIIENDPELFNQVAVVMEEEQ